jgi:hypothetical protein
MAPSVAATEDVSGHGAGLDKNLKVAAGVSSAGDEKIVVNTIRCLAADLCQQVSNPLVIIREVADWQYKGGHPGTVMGAATIGIALWRYHMQYNPNNADWLNRDRKLPPNRLPTKLTSRIRTFSRSRLSSPVHHASLLRIPRMDPRPDQELPRSHSPYHGSWSS